MPRFPALLLCLASVIAATAQISVTGLGVRLAPEPVEGFPVLAGVVVGSPADDARLEAGDRLTEIDGRPLRGMPTPDVLKLLRGASGEQRLLTIGEPMRRVTLTLRLLRGTPLAGNCENGIGTFQDLDGSTYQGRFVNGRYDGEGELIYLDGHRYKGGFAHGRFHGFGSEDWPNGDHYEGNFNSGHAEGRGTLWFEARRESYTGEFVAGRPHGQGQLTMHHTASDFTGTFAAGNPVTGELELRGGGKLPLTPGDPEQLRLAAAAFRHQHTLVADARRTAENTAAMATQTRRAPAGETWGITPPSREDPASSKSKAAGTSQTAVAPAPRPVPCAGCSGTGREIDRCAHCRGTGVIRSERRYPKTVETPYSRSVWDSTGKKLIGQESGYQRRTETIVQVSESACLKCEKSSGFVITSRGCPRCGGSGVATAR